MSTEGNPPDNGGTTDETVRPVQDEVSLGQIAPGLAKQYDNFQDALQEVIDNGISASVPNEGYFENPDAYDPVELYLALIREGDTVWFVVGDNGGGIDPDTLAETVFEVSNTSASTGILNNVGWGVKQSLSWFESKVNDAGLETESGEPPAFRMVTRPETHEQAYKVEGPITNDKYVEPATEEEWEFGVKDEVTNLEGLDHGTRVHLPCSWEQVNKDLWGGNSTTLTKRAQALRTHLGIAFRRILNAREENRIVLTVVDRDDPDMASMEVHPIDLQFEQYEGDERPVTFDITVDDVTYNIEYERGRLDFEAMAGAAREADDRLVTSGGNLRTGYQPAKKYQGVDVYANGRVMMTSVFEDLYRKQTSDEYLSRDDVYNHFGGEVRIIPENPADSVPTDNKKTAVDTSHELWERLEEELKERGGPLNTYRAKPVDEADSEQEADESPDDDASGADREADEREADDEEGQSDTRSPDESSDRAGGNADDDGDNPGASGTDDGSDNPTTDGGPTTGTLGRTDEAEDDEGDAEDVGVVDMDASEFRRRFREGEFDHDDLVDRLEATLEDESMTARVDTEMHYKGTRVDVDQVLEDGSHILWEVRNRQGNRRAIYDISMYQDVFKETNEPADFHRSVLLSDGLSTDAADALRDDDQRRDVCGEPYELDQKDILDKLG